VWRSWPWRGLGADAVGVWQNPTEQISELANAAEAKRYFIRSASFKGVKLLI
jgi:hypothetical protein